MKALIQRVKRGSVTIAGQEYSKIGPGLVILLGIGKGDDEAAAKWLARKTATLRIFPDEAGKFNYSILDIQGEALVVSQFTLYADCQKGARPGFEMAAEPKTADMLYNIYLNELKKAGIPTKTGVFQAEMLVKIANDGPVTILLEK